MSIVEILETLYDFISLLIESVKNVAGFIMAMITLLPKLLFTIFNSMPDFFRYGFEALIGFVMLIMIAKFIALIIPMKK